MVTGKDIVKFILDNDLLGEQFILVDENENILKYITIDEFAKKCNVSTEVVKAWDKLKTINSVHILDMVLIPDDEIDPRRKMPDDGAYIILPKEYNSKSAALRRIDMLQEICDKYGKVTVADYYDICNLSSVKFTDTKYGWYDLEDAIAVKNDNGKYVIKFPRTVQL